MKKVIFVGQAMPRIKQDPHDWPTLNKWLFKIGLTIEIIRENFLYSALVDYFPGSYKGSHVVPTKDEIVKERPRLQKLLRDYNPEIVVTVGKLSAVNCLQKDIQLLSDIIGSKFLVDPYNLVGENKLIIPLPHPSGASVWKTRPDNKILLKKALNLLKDSLFD